MPNRTNPWSSYLPQFVSNMILQDQAQKFRDQMLEREREHELMKSGYTTEAPVETQENATMTAPGSEQGAGGPSFTANMPSATPRPDITVGGKGYYAPKVQISSIKGLPEYVLVQQGPSKQFLKREEVEKDLTNTIKEYQYAVKTSGYKGSFPEWVREGKNKDANLQRKTRYLEDPKGGTIAEEYDFDPQTGKEIPRNRYKYAGQLVITGYNADGTPNYAPSRGGPLAASGPNLSKEQVWKLGEGRANTQSLIDNIEDVQDIVGNNASVIGTLGKAQSKLDSISEQLSALATKLGGTAELKGTIVTDKRLTNPDNYKFTSLSPDAQKSAQTKSLMTKLGYAVARSQNPDGRISDADVQNGIDQLGGTIGSPAQMHAVLNKIKAGTVRDFGNFYESVAKEKPKEFKMRYPEGYKISNVPSLDEWLIQARKANPNSNDQELTDYYNNKYGAR